MHTKKDIKVKRLQFRLVPHIRPWRPCNWTQPPSWRWYFGRASLTMLSRRLPLSSFVPCTASLHGEDEWRNIMRGKYLKDNPLTKARANRRRRTVNGQRIYPSHPDYPHPKSLADTPIACAVTIARIRARVEEALQARGHPREHGYRWVHLHRRPQVPARNLEDWEVTRPCSQTTECFVVRVPV